MVTIAKNNETKTKKKKSDGKKYLDLQEKSIDQVVAQVNKIFGDRALIKMGDNKVSCNVDVISTGSIKVDQALMIGGLPRGRIVEIYGPEAGGKTTLSLGVIARVQQQGGAAAFIDAEHALDASLARSAGVNVDDLFLCQPDYGEQGLEILHMLAASAKFDVIVVDSVAALVPKEEIDGEMGQSHMGLQARMMGQALRKITGVVKKSNTLVIFINQIRYKIGVFFGCFHEDTPVTFADGTQHYIREIYEKKLEGPVLSLNTQTGAIEEKRIINWYKNGKLAEGEKWTTVSLGSVGGIRGNMSFTVTPYHKVFRRNSDRIQEVPVSKLLAGDHLVSWYKKTIGNNQELVDAITGSMLGDGEIRRRNKATACLSLANQQQPEYLKWKLDILSELDFVPISSSVGRPRFDSKYTTELSLLRDTFYPSGKGYRCCSRRLKLSPLSLAVWYMDDGTYTESHCRALISIARFFRHDMDYAQERRKVLLAEVRRVIDSDDVVIHTKSKCIYIPVKAFARMSRKIRKYVPSCMQYKLLPEDRGKYSWNGPPKSELTREIVYAEIQDIQTGSGRKHRCKWKYDLQVDGNSNYPVGGSWRGVFVHNSNENTSGGKALKFYASVRIDIRRIGALKRDGQIIGNRTKVNVVKNKLAPPCKIIETDLIFGKGFIREAEILDLAIISDVVEKNGSWLNFDNERLAQGRQAAVDVLINNPQLCEKIYAKLDVVQAMADDLKEDEDDDE